MIAVLLATVFVVTSNADSGPGTFRATIEQSNANPGPDVINVQPSALTAPVRLSSPLPPLTDSVAMMGSGMVLDGTNAGPDGGFVITADDAHLYYFSLINFDGDGLVIRGDRNQIYGITSSGNRGYGVVLATTAQDNLLGQPRSSTLIGPGFGPLLLERNGRGGIRIDGARNHFEFSRCDDNGGDGVVVTGEDTVLRFDTASRNEGFGYTVLAPAVYSANSGSCNRDGLVNSVHAASAPVLQSVVTDVLAFTAYGSLQGEPDTRYWIDLLMFGDTCRPETTGRDGVEVTTDADGFAQFRHTMFADGSPRMGAVATRIVNGSTNGGTSPLSQVAAIEKAPVLAVDLAVHAIAPASVAPGSDVTIEYVITNRGPVAAVFSSAKFGAPAGASVSDLRTEGSSNGSCFAPDRNCVINLLGPGETARLFRTLHVTGAPGTQLIDEVQLLTGLGGRLDPDVTNNTARLQIAITARRHATGR